VTRQVLGHKGTATTLARRQQLTAAAGLTKTGRRQTRIPSPPTHLALLDELAHRRHLLLKRYRIVVLIRVVLVLSKDGRVAVWPAVREDRTMCVNGESEQRSWGIRAEEDVRVAGLISWLGTGVRRRCVQGCGHACKRAPLTAQREGQPAAAFEAGAGRGSTEREGVGRRHGGPHQCS
jgi:hypothetical protein